MMDLPKTVTEELSQCEASLSSLYQSLQNVQETESLPYIHRFENDMFLWCHQISSRNWDTMPFGSHCHLIDTYARLRTIGSYILEKNYDILRNSGYP